MSDTQTVVRTQIAIDDHAYYLAQGQDVSGLQKRIEDAVRAGGRFERFVVVGNREMWVLFTATSRVSFSIETVPDDEHDIGDAVGGFGGFFDE